MYPKAEVLVGVQDQMYLLNVMTLIEQQCSFPVLKRAQAKASLQPLPDLDGSLSQGGTKGPRKSRRQQRLMKYLGTPALKPDTEGLEAHGWQVPENIAMLQREDETLKPLFDKAEGQVNIKVSDELYVIQNDVMFVQSGDVVHLVVPMSCRPLVIHLAHTIPWAGHLAQQKTYTRIITRFF